MDLNVEAIRLATDRIQAGADRLRELGVEELARRNDLTAGRIATEADRFEAIVDYLNETVLKGAK